MITGIAIRRGGRRACWFLIGRGRHVRHLRSSDSGLRTIAVLRRASSALCVVVLFLVLCVPAAFAQHDIGTAKALIDRGVEAYQIGDMSGAAEAWSKAVAIYKTLPGSERVQADCSVSIGGVLIYMEKYEEAIRRQEEALALYRSLNGSERDQANCSFNIGVALVYMGKYEQAIQQQEQALAIYKTIQGTERQQANCTVHIGKALYATGKYEQAIQRQEQALAIYKIVKGTERLQAGCYKNIGFALRNMRKYADAIQRQEQALAIFNAIEGTEREQAGCYQSIGIALDYMGKYEEAIERQGRALAIYRTIKGTEHDQADCHGNIGITLTKMGKCEEGIQRETQALMIFKTIQGTEREQANCYKNIGIAFHWMGKHKEAIQRQEQALVMLQPIRGTESEQASCHQNIGVTLGEMGGYEEAVQRQALALAIFKTIEGAESDEQANCYNSIGGILIYMGKYEEAIQRFEQALVIYRNIQGTERAQAECCNNNGACLTYIGKYEEAIQNYEHALAMYKTIKGTDRGQASCYQNIGWTLGEMGRYQDAIQRQEQALAIFNAIEGTEREQASCWGNVGKHHLAVGRYAAAITACERARRAGWISPDLPRAYRLRGQEGDEERALQRFLESVRVAEQERSLVKASEHREAIFQEPAQVFPDFVGLLAELAVNKSALTEPSVTQWAVEDKSESIPLAAAFHYADRGKGRSLEDALREKSALKSARADIRLLAEDRELSLSISKLTSLREPLPESDVERRKKLTEEIDSLQQRRNMIEVELKKTALGGYVAPEFRKPMEMAKELEPDRAVLQYSVGEKEGWLLILTREGITAHKLAAETAALPELLPRQEATIAKLAEAWKKRSDKVGLDGLVRLARARAEDLSHPEAVIPATARDDLVTRAEKSPCQTTPRHNVVDATTEQAILERLGEVVLPDSALAEMRKKGIRRLLVIPDGSLHYIPFAMLRIKNEKEVGKHYLIEEFSSSYVPAMTTLDTIRKQSKEREAKRKLGRRELLAFANPTYGSETVPTLPPTMVKDDMVTRLRSFRNDYYKSGGLCLMASLPETEQEAVRVASLFAPPKEYKQPLTDDPEGKAVIFVGKAASEEQAKRLLGIPLGSQSVTNESRITSHELRLPAWRYLLFSTHGLADTHNGMLSCLALSSPTADSEEDGFLQAQEVMNLELDADLVMLSACQTGLGRLRGGEGLVGLSAAFFYAGAESVCASLWQVPSGPTSQLVPEFFKQLKEGKVDKAEALRQAQLHVLRQGQGPDGKPADYSSPFCWAAFVLMGEHK